MCVLPGAVGGRTEPVREIDSAFRRQRQSIVEVVRRVRGSSDSRFDATADALTIHRGLSLIIEASDTGAAGA